MPKNLITWLGVLVALLPFITVQSSIKMPLYIASGVIIAVVSYREKHPRRKSVQQFASRKSKKGVVIAGVTSPIEVAESSTNNPTNEHATSGTV